MQNRYVGDIGDFGKYGLLRKLCDGSPHLKLGVVWYLYNPINERTSDGGHIGYLDCNKAEPTKRNWEQFWSCDPELYQALREIVKNKRRGVSEIRERGVLPRDTVFYEEELTFDDLSPSAHEERKTRRDLWCESAVKQTEDCQIVFLDPDNGLEAKSVGPYRRKGPKYVFLKEVKPYVERKQSVVLYQQLGRDEKAEGQISKRLKQLDAKLRVDGISALRYQRGPARVFFVIPALRHRETLCQRIEDFVQGCWGKHFK